MASLANARIRSGALQRMLIAVAVTLALAANTFAQTPATTIAGSAQADDQLDLHAVRLAGSADARVLTRKEIEAAGWHRLAQLFEGATGASRFSVDGFTYGIAGDRLPAAGISGAGAAEWLIFVDGVRVPVGALGLQFAELLPVTLMQIDSARFSAGPALIAGVPAPRGALELFTAASNKGFHVGASYMRGDETGDPGPFRYTALSSPNVEKIGPFSSLTTGYGGSRASVDVSYHGATFTSSDTNIVRRIPAGAFTERNQYNESNTFSLRARVHGPSGEHALSLSRGTQHGLIFVPHGAGEGDLAVALAAGSLSGTMVRGGTRAEYVLSASSMPIEMRSVVLASLDTSVRRNFQAIITGSRIVHRTILSLTGAATHWRLEQPRLLQQTSSQRIAIGARRGNARWSAELDLGMTHASTVAPNPAEKQSQPARFLIDHSLTARFTSASHWTVLLNTAQFEASSAADGGWTNVAPLGAAGFAQLPIIQRILGGMQTRPRPFRTSAFVSLSRAARWMLAERVAAPVSGTTSPPPSVTVLGATIDVQTDTTVSFFARLAVAASMPTGGTDAMREGIGSTMSSEARFTIAFEPFANVRTSALLHVASGSQWPTLDAMSPASGPPIRRVDLTFEKWAFERRVRAQLILRNLLNSAERYHPFGAQWNLRTEVGVTVTQD